MIDELHIKGELSEKGFLKESYSNELDDLTHELTDLGREEVRKMLKETKYRKIFMDMVIEASNNNPEIAKDLIIGAMNKLK